MEFVCNIIELINKQKNIFEYNKSYEWQPNKFSNNQKQILTSFPGPNVSFLVPSLYFLSRSNNNNNKSK